jgi:LmbE family N-acetylglucosaminyl deacetylase
MGSEKVHLCVIGAHIGDAEVTAGGLICKYTAAGNRATIIHLTAGEKGSPRLSPEEYRAQKIREATESARIMGAEAIVLDYKDGELPNNDEVKYQICDLIRELKPDILVTHWQGSFHKDHRNCYHVVTEGAFYAAVPGIKRAQPAHAVKLLYFAENWEDPYGYQPDIWINISPVYERWLEALRQHALFRGEVASFDYWRYYTGLANMRGAEVCVPQAETFMLPAISRKTCLEFFPMEKPVLIF